MQSAANDTAEERRSTVQDDMLWMQLQVACLESARRIGNILMSMTPGYLDPKFEGELWDRYVSWEGAHPGGGA